MKRPHHRSRPSPWMLCLVPMLLIGCGPGDSSTTSSEPPTSRGSEEVTTFGPPARLVSGAQSQTSAQWRAHSAVLPAGRAHPTMRSASFELRASSLSASTSIPKERP